MNLAVRLFYCLLHYLCSASVCYKTCPVLSRIGKTYSVTINKHMYTAFRRQEFYSVDSKGHCYTELSSAGLHKQWLEKLKKVEEEARYVGDSRQNAL